ncbi:MAG TPA: hypothetical protein VLX68_10390 [Chitinivibrionales bacterium]|nr:hypothetical protein [Chitinivibrionales bacterium]
MPEEEKDELINSDSEQSFEVDPRDFSKHWQYLKKRENILLGTAAGIGAAIVALVIWGFAVKFTGYKLGWIAMASSFGIGFAIQYFGKGVSPVFGIIGGGIVFFTWLAGNFITAALIFSRVKSISFLTIMSRMDFPMFGAFLQAVIGPVDWLLLLAATYIAYFFGFKKVAPPQ